MRVRRHPPSNPPSRGRASLGTALLAALAAVAAGAVAPPPAAADAWQPKTPPLTTPWTHEVGPGNALPDYPRPQLTRSRWRNLNGLWQFADAAPGEQPPVGRDLDERILVPYPVESALSGGGEQPPGTPGLDGVSFYPFDEGSGTTTADAVGVRVFDRALSAAEAAKLAESGE